MKYLFVAVLFVATACSNPYINPNTSKAVSEEKQIQLLAEQNKLLQTQNLQLERIAVALEKVSNK